MTPRRSPRLRLVGRASPWRARLIRAALLGAVVLALHVRGRAAREEESPVAIAEVKPFLPDAISLQPDGSSRAGLHVVDDFGQRIGYAVRTQPAARDVVGYAGPTDTLVVFDQNDRVLGLRIRRSADTPDHVADVRSDFAFMEQLDGLGWDEVASRAGGSLDAVSGASLTSRAVMGGIARRIRARAEGPRWRWGARDTVAVVAVAGALALAFASRRVRGSLRVAFSVAVVLALGIVGGDFVSQDLLVGWAAGAVPWRESPGLVVLCAAAFLVPWGTGKAVYCQQICPHGLLQDLVARVSPWRWRVRVDVRRALRWLPRGLLLIVVAWAAIGVSDGYAALEPFHAYMFTSAAVLSVVLAVASLLVAFVVPRGYCRFACPTGALLAAVRVAPRPRADTCATEPRVRSTGGVA